MKPFNLHDAIAGEPICDREGRKCTFVAFSEGIGQKVVARGHAGHISLYDEDGSFYSNYECEDDLFMAEQVKVKKEGWISVSLSYPPNIYTSKEEGEIAIVGIKDARIVKIEWEE